MKQRPDQHFVGLDGLRGVAAFVVMFLHGTLYIDVGYIPPAACLAVDFFFLLSGFVIAYAYDERMAGGMPWRQFMAIRTVRLYPMLCFGTVAGVIPFILAEVIQKHQFDLFSAALITAGSLVLIPVGLVVGHMVAFPLNAPVWSLFFEFAVSALYGTRFGRLGSQTIAAVVAAGAVALIGMAVWRGPFTCDCALWVNTPATFLLGFIRATYPFWAGVLLFRVVVLRVVPRVPLGLIALVLATLLLLPVDNSAYNVLLVLVAFPLLVLLATRAPIGDATGRLCSLLGRLSYPLYLIHWPVYRVIHGVVGTHFPWVALIAGGVISTVAAHLVLTLYDEPLRLAYRSAARASGTNPRLRSHAMIRNAVPTNPTTANEP